MKIYRVKYIYGDDTYILADSMSEAAATYAKANNEDAKDLEYVSSDVLISDAIKDDIKSTKD